MTEGTETRGRAAGCGHWLAPGTRFYRHDGADLCVLCASRHAVTTPERQAILGLPPAKGSTP